MAKYAGKCPSNYDLNIYSGCPLGCLYCVEYFFHEKNSQLIAPAPELISKLELTNLEQDPVYFSPKTDAYQPLEETHKATREVIATLAAKELPFFVITKEPLIWRDREYFVNRENAFIAVSMNSLDDEFAARLEPGAALPSARKKLVEDLCALKNIRVVVKIDPIIPGVTDMSRLDDLSGWLTEVKPYAVTAETLRMNQKIFDRMSTVISNDEQDSVQKHYPSLGDEIVHTDLSYRTALFQKMAALFKSHTMRASFCKASLPMKITSYDCRGGFDWI